VASMRRGNACTTRPASITMRYLQMDCLLLLDAVLLQASLARVYGADSCEYSMRHTGEFLPGIAMRQTQRISVHQISRYCCMSAAILLFVRFSIAFHESYAVIRSERIADQDLIELCTSGAARQSAKMRTACLDAQSENAAPIFMKAFVKTSSDATAAVVSTFSSYLGWPAKAVGLVVLLGVFAIPIRSLADSLRGVANGHSSAAHHTIYVLNGDEHCTIEDYPDPQTKFSKLRSRMTSRSPPMLSLPWHGDEEAQRKEKWL